MYTEAQPFEWDPRKAAANFRKHGVQFTEATGVFADDNAITISDQESDSGEQRFVTVGTGIKGRVLVVVFAIAGRAFESSQPASPDGPNAKNMRHSHEKEL